MCRYEADFLTDLRVLMRVLTHVLTLVRMQVVLMIGVEDVLISADTKPTPPLVFYTGARPHTLLSSHVRATSLDDPRRSCADGCCD